MSFFLVHEDSEAAVLLHHHNVMRPQDQTVVFVGMKHHVEYLSEGSPGSVEAKGSTGRPGLWGRKGDYGIPGYSHMGRKRVKDPRGFPAGIGQKNSHCLSD
ncbi:Collagen Alpha-5(Vi) Chain [Manis pentadactyla]|nr:Collagen Alpha-5(Vi) Chain [Manis pentadactyla]